MRARAAAGQDLPPSPVVIAARRGFPGASPPRKKGRIACLSMDWGQERHPGTAARDGRPPGTSTRDGRSPGATTRDGRPPSTRALDRRPPAPINPEGRPPGQAQGMKSWRHANTLTGLAWTAASLATKQSMPTLSLPLPKGKEDHPANENQVDKSSDCPC